MSSETLPTIGIVGGTGDLGGALARCWAASGYSVVIGSRSTERAEAAATMYGFGIRGLNNAAAAQAADIVVLAVPFSSHETTLQEIKDAVNGKIIIDAVVPLAPPKVSVVSLPKGGSAAQIAQSLLGREARITAAFHNVSAKKLQPGKRAECDILVFGDDRQAREVVIGLANVVALRGIDGGLLANCVAAEALTSVLISINKRYKVDGAGIHITGI